jgi:hypothetical protein
MEDFFRTLLPPETLKVMGDDVLNSYFAYINLQTDSAQLNLAPLKTSLVGDTACRHLYTSGYTASVLALPDRSMTLNALSGGKVEFCNPPPSYIQCLHHYGKANCNLQRRRS